MSFPRMISVRQSFPRPTLDDIEGTTGRELYRVLPADLSGKRIAVTGGSRGIANIACILRVVVSVLKERGAEPFIIPAMGSHGGATAEGQVEVLSTYGITEGYCGAPIYSSMEVEQIGQTASGVPVYMDRFGHAADGVVLVNRIKSHTDFKAPVESGLHKMAAIGLGKQAQALALHRQGIRGIRDRMREVADFVIASGHILCGVGIVENAYDETAHIEAISTRELGTREPELLLQSKSMMPRLPVENIDLLIIDEIGKNISGTGLDTNIIGRMRVPGEPEPESPRIKYIFVRDMTEETHGNATGIGLADITTQRLLKNIDFQALNENVATSTFVGRAMIPIALESDERAIREGLRACWGVEPEDARIVHIKNTLDLEHVRVSEPLLAEVQGQENLTVLGDPEPMRFDGDGNLSL